MENQKPIKIISHNSVRAAIWENHGSKGRYFQTTFERVYKDGDSVKSTKSMREKDLADLSFVAYEAARVVSELRGCSE